ncbi:molybdenum cofactor biosynthesis protein MoaE [uncultured Chryseobacterium sp.]|jgi:Molybdopterin converting factor, large subunit|uniref:molybdenum cofactor biosynthesis protein MoaE n=1 Tax=uncultured Chryseobacterium sp. TaxID=259322 RepID=UPI00260B2C0D|nr:molybdenum cofactor biosynthesis protein MoaE [uncultured Chryseobacterium sp.]
MKKIKNIFIEGPIDPAFIAESIAKHTVKTSIGGHSIFLGQVREDKINDKKVESIEFTAYQEMALEKAHEIREEIITQYGLTCAHIYHSLGNIKVGEICLFVFTSAPHRKEAINACDEMVDRIKKEVPLWGKEILEDKSHSWKENKQ